MKPKFKVGQKVRLKPEKQIYSEIQKGLYQLTFTLMDDMPFGKIIKVLEVIPKGGTLKAIGGIDVPNDTGTTAYKIDDDGEEYYYDENYLENNLEEKINKILKL